MLGSVDVYKRQPQDPVTLDGGQVAAQCRAAQEAGAEGIVYMAGTWLLATHIVDAVLQSNLPAAIWGIPEPVSFSSVGCLSLIHILCITSFK